MSGNPRLAATDHFVFHAGYKYFGHAAYFGFYCVLQLINQCFILKSNLNVNINIGQNVQGDLVYS